MGFWAPSAPSSISITIVATDATGRMKKGSATVRSVNHAVPVREAEKEGDKRVNGKTSNKRGNVLLA